MEVHLDLDVEENDLVVVMHLVTFLLVSETTKHLEVDRGRTLVRQFSFVARVIFIGTRFGAVQPLLGVNVK